jgi:hypothetical protein
VLVALAMAIAFGACSPLEPSVAELSISANPATVSSAGGEIVLTATVRQSDGAPVTNVFVHFTTTAGSLSDESVKTDPEGIARVRLTATESTTIRARAQGKAIDIVLPVQNFELTLTPAQPGRNQLTTIHIRLGAAGQTVSGNLTIDFGDGQTADLGMVTGEATTQHAWRDEGAFTMTVTLRQGAAESRSTTQVEVSGFSPLSDQIDARLVTWLSPATTNVSDWAITSEIRSISIDGSTICIDHSKSGQWPLVSIDDNPPNIEANIAIVVNVDGQWYGSGFDWLGEGRICKTVDPSEYGVDQIRIPPLDHTWPGPRSGETVGLLITTPSSNRIPVRSVNERTPITLVVWP